MKRWQIAAVLEMPLPVYINIHTHTARSPAVQNVFELVNIYEHFETIGEDVCCSMGIHPWYIQDAEDQLSKLKQYAAGANVMAIGECGLDKVCDTDWQVQRYVFKAQIQWANTIGKPLIIHCVRAYSEVLQLLQEAKVPAIFHGFNKKLPLAEEIMNQGHYLSFGRDIFRDNKEQVLAHIPADRFFLETDDSAENIEEVYLAAASIRKTGADAIILQLQQNYKKVFGTQ